MAQITHEQGIVYESPDVHDHHVHVTPFWPMLVVFVSLVILTIITVVTAQFVDLPGRGNLLLALIIATIKGSLVVGWFMHIRYDKGMNLIVVLTSFFGVALFLGLTIADIAERPVESLESAQEIYPGGRLELYAGELPGERPKAAMNVVESAREGAMAESTNPAPAPVPATPAAPHDHSAH